MQAVELSPENLNVVYEDNPVRGECRRHAARGRQQLWMRNGEYPGNHRGLWPGHAFKENSETGESHSFPDEANRGIGGKPDNLGPGAARRSSVWLRAAFGGTQREATAHQVFHPKGEERKGWETGEWQS